jgi:anhydro-N-acetylmuramic acid kinase
MKENRSKIARENIPLIVAGVMSGTSADGIDVALVRITPRTNPDLERPKLELLAHRAYRFPRALRAAILGAMNAQSISTAELARLNWRLGLAYAEAVRDTVKETGIQPALVGCHGQTIYHQGTPGAYGGRRFACTWQLGEAALIAAECGVPVVSNFRPADMAAGGQGAPLVPFFDYMNFAHPTRARVLLNLGGIANLTAIPAAAGQDHAIAFDTGPGNMVIDALMQALYGKRFDRGGKTASQGIPQREVTLAFLKEKYFRLPPPKSAGREEFGAEYAARFLASCRKVSRKPEDAIASATALTGVSIADAVLRWVVPLTGHAPVDFIVSGGGARNTFLLGLLRQSFAPYHCTVTTIDASGIPAEAKEAAAFALLAWQTWHRRPGNVPSATGASRAAILGQITYA